MTHRHVKFNPLVIRQETGHNDGFNGKNPDGGVQTDSDYPSYIVFENRNNGGVFRPQLDDDPVYQYSSVRRIWADFKDASSWKIEHVHEEFYGDGSDRVRNITDDNTNSSPFYLELDLLLGPFEYIRISSSGSSGSEVVEVYFELLSRS